LLPRTGIGAAGNVVGTGADTTRILKFFFLNQFFVSACQCGRAGYPINILLTVSDPDPC
jgi:hypothetical protein